MKTNYVLVDFENVQPENMGLLKDVQSQIIVFVGANQKIPLGVARAIQPFGKGVDYVEIEGTGKNALDFHIAYYIGQLAAESPDSHFHIVSKDKGFDPLIRHLKRQEDLL